MALAVLSLTVTNAQTTIKGIIIGENNEKLAGATISTNDGTYYTKTDSLGNFVVSVFKNNTVFVASHTSHISKEFTVLLPSKTGLIVYLKANVKMLQEVEISTGYQTIPKERATGSFSTITKSRFNEQLSTDVISRIEAVANGVMQIRNTTGNPGIRIRGTSTISGPTDALIILDNFPYEGDIQNINPNDVENITILKDAAAASIWGARAGNGVIVITTKKGRQNQPLQITATANAKFTDKPNLFYLPHIQSKELIEVEKYLFANEYRFSDTASLFRPAFSPVYEILFRQRNGKISTNESSILMNELSSTNNKDDYLRNVYKPSVNQQYAVNLSGGSNFSSWFLSSGYDNNISNLDGRYDRLNLNFKHSITVLKSLKVSSSLYFTQSNNKSGKEEYGNYLIPSYIKLIDQNGTPLAVPRTYRDSFLDTLGSGKLLDWKYLPFDDFRHTQTRSQTNDLLFNLAINYEFAKWLNFDLKYQYEKQKVSGNTSNGLQSYYTRDLINQFSEIDVITNVINYRVPYGAILDLNDADMASNNLRGQLNFQHHWSKHQIAGLFGMDIRDNANNSKTSRIYGYNENILTTSNVDYTTPFPNIITGDPMFINSNQGIYSTTNRFVSAFGNGAYTYDNRYTLSLSTRRDASNIFGVNTNDKWNLLWSTGTAWNISSERFYKSEIIPYLRLRASYGFSGNVDLTRSAVTTISYSLANSPYTLQPIARITKDGNPDLKWEKVRMLNIALDFSTIGNRISGSIDFFTKKSTDLYGIQPMDYTTGIYGTLITNTAAMQGKGLDIELNSKNLTGQLKWTSNLNLSFYKDKVSDYYNDATLASSFVSSSSSVNISGIVGKPLYSIYSYKWRGLDPANGDPMGYINSQVSKNYDAITGDSTKLKDLVYSGSALPTIYGSMGNTLNWKNFSLTARLVYKFGYYYRKAGINYSDLYNGRSLGHAEFSNRWQNPGDEMITNVPSMTFGASTSRDLFYNSSEIMVEKGDNIRIQYITAGYDFNKNQFKRLPFQNIHFFVNISNLGIIWKASKGNVDPDYSAYVIPPSKSYAIGLSLTL